MSAVTEARAARLAEAIRYLDADMREAVSIGRALASRVGTHIGAGKPAAASVSRLAFELAEASQRIKAGADAVARLAQSTN